LGSLISNLEAGGLASAGQSPRCGIGVVRRALDVQAMDATAREAIRRLESAR
jgi:hypothetical protein